MKNLVPIIWLKATNTLQRAKGNYYFVMTFAFLVVFLFGWTSSIRTDYIYLESLCRDTLMIDRPVYANIPPAHPSPTPMSKQVGYQDRVNEFKSKIGYTPYEVLMIYTKAHEGFSPTWYKDGIVKGRQSYSIGYGINNQGDKRLHKLITNLYTRNGKSDKTLATKAIADYFMSYKAKTKGMDIFEETAWLLHRYNRGTPKMLDRCCGSKKPGCGSPQKKVRAAHGERRRFESALAKKDFAFVKSELKKCLEEEL